MLLNGEFASKYLYGLLVKCRNPQAAAALIGPTRFFYCLRSLPYFTYSRGISQWELGQGNWIIVDVLLWDVIGIHFMVGVSTPDRNNITTKNLSYTVHTIQPSFMDWKLLYTLWMFFVCGVLYSLSSALHPSLIPISPLLSVSHFVFANLFTSSYTVS